ncbi:hypothetical protein SAMN05421579_1572 [Xenorhabdus japonica]|uniref:Uncharacterized protein n=1 Tax=Xenorhabdus japonica TaxID=53341 RepID=A0A1I5E8B5_9GAMM|nr:hypothetical protein [Xenorhabdus japonica]SFO07687.1 hypothetical protein SAMN05421579_1572 [Xenorhabdus japonica]
MVIAKSGFGELYLCGQETDRNLSISRVFNTIFCHESKTLS